MRENLEKALKEHITDVVRDWGPSDLDVFFEDNDCDESDEEEIYKWLSCFEMED